MPTKTCSNVQLERIQYMPLPNTNKADVRLRENIEEVTDEEGAIYWQADEVYFRAAITLEEVEANFNELYANGGPLPTAADAETEEDKFTALEEQIAALSSSVKTVTEELTVVATALNAGEAVSVSEDGTITAIDKTIISDATPIDGAALEG